MIIGIYGKIGAGKTTISKYFKKNNFYIINVDYIAKIALKNNFIANTLKKQMPYIYDNYKISKNKIKNIIFKDIYNNMKFNIVFLPYLSNIIKEIINKLKCNILIEGAVINMLNIKYDYLFYLNCTETKTIKRKKQIYKINEIKSLLKIQKYIISKKNADLILKNNYIIFKKLNYKKMLKFIGI